MKSRIKRGWILNQQYDNNCVNLKALNWSKRREEIPHIQGQRNPSKTLGTGAAVRRYPTSKGRGEAPARWWRWHNLLENPATLPPESLRWLKRTLWAPGPRDPTETETEGCLSVSWAGPGQQWPAAGTQLRVQQTWAWHKPSWRRSPVTSPQSCQNLHRTGKQTPVGTNRTLCTRTQEKGAVTPQKTDPDLAVSVLESPAEAWVGGGLLQGCGHWLRQYMRGAFWRRSPLSSLHPQ